MSERRPIRVMYPASLEPGGAERQLMLLAQHLPADRFQVSFVLLGEMTEMAREAERLGASVHVLGATRRRGDPMPVFGARVAGRVATYVRLCRAERYDIVDAWLYLQYALSALVRPVAAMPVLLAGRRSLSGFKEGFGLVERTIDQIATRSVDRFVANSQAVAEDVVAREGIRRRRIRVIRNGVVIPPERDAVRRAAAREMLGVPADAPVVGCVGTFKKGKGQDRVLEVMDIVWSTIPDAWIVLVGDGPTRAALEAVVAERGQRRVRFTGILPDARDAYDGFDALVSASDAEGLPNVVLEAAAAGLPVVATDAGGTREIIIDGVTGVLVPVADGPALAAGLIRVLLDPALAARLGAAARGHAEKAFGIDRFVSETAALYEELHARHGR
ncbi:MAG: glycosyltransferase [Chloroflexota bacterium]